MGPSGYGESRPLEPTPQTLPGCKSETNRRTELNVVQDCDGNGRASRRPAFPLEDASNAPIV